MVKLKNVNLTRSAVLTCPFCQNQTQYGHYNKCLGLKHFCIMGLKPFSFLSTIIKEAHLQDTLCNSFKLWVRWCICKGKMIWNDTDIWITKVTATNVLEETEKYVNSCLHTHESSFLFFKKSIFPLPLTERNQIYTVPIFCKQRPLCTPLKSIWTHPKIENKNDTEKIST